MIELREKILNLVSLFRKTRDKEVANQIVELYSSLKDKKNVLGKEIYAVAGVVFRIKNNLYSEKRVINKSDNNRKKDEVELSTLFENNYLQIRNNFYKFYEQYRAERTPENIEKVCQYYDSIPNGVKKYIFTDDYERIKNRIAKLKKIKASNPLCKENHKKQKITSKMLKASTPGKTNTVINLSYRLEKFEIRKYLLELAKSYSPISAFTLPGTEWIFERDLLLQNNCKSIVGIEVDPVVYEFSKHNMPPVKNIDFYNISDKEFFAQEKHSFLFDLLWLDYMGQFNFQRLQVFENAIKNGFLKDECLVALTFMGGRETSDVLEVYQQTCPKEKNMHEARKTVIPNKYKEIAEKYGYEVEVLKAQVYKEEMGACKAVPMVFIALQLRKRK